MEIDISPITNKQRIYIGGTHEVDEIINLTQKVLESIKKPVDFFNISYSPKFTDAPVVIMNGADRFSGDRAAFMDLEIHMLLLHRMEDTLPEGYHSFDQFVQEYERLADSLPKAGTLIYLEEDDLSTMIGKKEREDVKSIEYNSLKAHKTNNGFTLKTTDDEIDVVTSQERFPCIAAAAKTLLNRIGVSDVQFFTALKTIK